MIRRLFTYGTLRDPQVLFGVIGRQLARPPRVGRLQGFERRLDLAPWPLAVPEPGATIDGLLWFGLSGRDFELLDQYEGIADRLALYHRTVVAIELFDTPVIARAWVYVATPELAQQLA